MIRIAESVPFRDPVRAAALYERLAAGLPESAAQRLRPLLASIPDPDTALHYLERLREQQPEAFHRLSLSPPALQMLVTVLAQSHFLAEELMRAPEWLEELPESGELHQVLATEQFLERLEKQLGAAGPGVPPAVELARFRRKEILRILARDLLGYGTLSDVTEELSNLADAIIDCAYFRVRHQLASRHGEPAEGSFSVISLGKLGGRELNYSSDIDLLFLYSNNGETDGEEPVSNKEFFKKLCNQLTQLLAAYTEYGFCYRVDLRLRPEGTLGEVCTSLEGARTYYQTRARDWELQMLIKARVSAGDPAVGRALLEFVEPLTYTTSTDFSAIEAVSVARERIGEKVARRKAKKAGFDIKLSPGGIRDIEFLVQCLQRLHGGREPFLRHGGTLLALFRLHNKALLSDAEYGRLASAYQFLRTLEHRLQFANDLQTHLLPEDSQELELLARRMPVSQVGTAPSAAALREQLETHLSDVREIYERVIHAQRPLTYRASGRTREAAGDAARSAAGEAGPDSGTGSGGAVALVAGETAAGEAAAGSAGPEGGAGGRPGGAPAVGAAGPGIGETAPSNLVRSLEIQAPGLGATISRSRLRFGARNFEHFLERALPSAQWLRWLDEDAVLAGYVIDLFEHSPFFAEQLIRRPELIEELHQMRCQPQSWPDYGEAPALLADPMELRRFFRREMLRIQAESICVRTPVFDTLKRTSALAGCVIEAAYQMAVTQTLAANPPVAAGYQPRSQMMVIALGRLGMLEFDLASDADLIFVLPDADSSENLFWTQVANRTIDIITAYTGEGVVFAVDTRLRPNGREGPLVQTEVAYKDYFEKSAEAWEGITYMKSRAVAGDLDRGTRFLSELQDVDWRRYGQGGRSKDKLRQMRKRLADDQGAANPLKAGPGGYYDIDFALMYLRLKGAGIFYKVLNTPERIDVIEKMGHLDRPDAAFLRDAATLYRALDHGLRLSSGHAEGTIPNSPLQLQILTELVSRWTPDHLHDQPLPVALEQIRTRTRDFFDRVFA